MEAAERETTIQWSDADKVVHVFTAQFPMARRFKRVQGARLIETSRGPQGEWLGEEWEIPLWAVTIRTVQPRKTGNSSPAVLERLRLGRETRKKAESARRSDRLEAQ